MGLGPLHQRYHPSHCVETNFPQISGHRLAWQFGVLSFCLAGGLWAVLVSLVHFGDAQSSGRPAHGQVSFLLLAGFLLQVR